MLLSVFCSEVYTLRGELFHRFASLLTWSNARERLSPSTSQPRVCPVLRQSSCSIFVTAGVCLSRRSAQPSRAPTASSVCGWRGWHSSAWRATPQTRTRTSSARDGRHHSPCGQDETPSSLLLFFFSFLFSLSSFLFFFSSFFSYLFSSFLSFFLFLFYFIYLYLINRIISLNILFKVLFFTP